MIEVLLLICGSMVVGAALFALGFVMGSHARERHDLLYHALTHTPRPAPRTPPPPAGEDPTQVLRPMELAR